MLYFWGGSKITADGDCNHEIKRHLLLGRKAMTNLDSILKSRDITLPTKVHLVKPMVFPVVIYGCEHWTIKKAEHWSFDAFELVLEETLESPLDCKEIQPVHPKGGQSWIFFGRTDAESETPIFGHLLWRTDSLEKTLMLGNIESGRRREWWRMRWLDGIMELMDMNLSKLQEFVVDREAWHTAVHGVADNQTQLSNWTELQSMLGGFPGGWVVTNWPPIAGDAGLVSGLGRSPGGWNGNQLHWEIPWTKEPRGL